MSSPTNATSVWNYNGDGVNQSFSVPQPIQSVNDVKVTTTTAGVTTAPYTVGVDYNITGIGTNSINVVFLALVPQVGTTITIKLSVVLVPNTSISTITTNSGTVIQGAIDKLSLQDMSLQQQITDNATATAGGGVLSVNGNTGAVVITAAGINAAPINSPAFTGTPTAPTQTAGDNSTKLATTAFVATSFAPIASPTFTGTPAAPTPSMGDSSTKIATTAFVAGATRIRLTGNTTFYVATTGNDSTGNGTSGTPWATIQKAINVLSSGYDLAGYTATISVAAGTYTSNATIVGLLVGQEGPGALVLQGNGTCNITTSTASTCFGFIQGAMATVQGFTFSASASGAIAMQIIDRGTLIFIGNNTFGSFTAGKHIALFDGACAKFYNSAITITGGASNFLSLDGMSYFNATSGTNTVTLTGTPAFSTAFVSASTASNVYCFSSTLSFSGSSTGVRYALVCLAQANTAGAGASYFPGNSAGTTASGAQYI